MMALLFSLPAVAANITDSPQALVVTAPNPVTFSCTASGLPRPNITWLDPSSAVLMSGSGGVTITETRIGERVIVSTLNISMTVPSNSGNYTCVADNDVTGQGDLNRVDATLSVHGKNCFKNPSSIQGKSLTNGLI